MSFCESPPPLFQLIQFPIIDTPTTIYSGGTAAAADDYNAGEQWIKKIHCWPAIFPLSLSLAEFVCKWPFAVVSALAVIEKGPDRSVARDYQLPSLADFLDLAAAAAAAKWPMYHLVQQRQSFFLVS